MAGGGSNILTGTFGATGVSATFTPKQGPNGPGAFNVSLWGTWSATVALQRTFDDPNSSAANWMDVSKPDLSDGSFTGNINFAVSEPEPNVSYRLNCTAYTSGAVSYRLGQ